MMPFSTAIKIQHQVSKRAGFFAAMTAICVAFIVSFIPLWSPMVFGGIAQSLQYTNYDQDTGHYFPVDSADQVHAGSVLLMHVSACNNTNRYIRIKVSRRLIPVRGGEDTLLSDTETTWPPGCGSIISQIHVIPPSTVPGRYYLSGISTVPTVPPTDLEWRSVEFEVVK